MATASRAKEDVISGYKARFTKEKFLEQMLESMEEISKKYNSLCGLTTTITLLIADFKKKPSAEITKSLEKHLEFLAGGIDQTTTASRGFHRLVAGYKELLPHMLQTH